MNAVRTSRRALGAWLLTAAAALLPGTARAYKINTTEAGLPIRWGVDTVGFRLDPTLAEVLPRGQTRAAVDIAFDAWRGFASVPDLQVTAGEPEAIGYRSGGPTNGLYLVRDWPHEADKLAVTVVTYDLRSGRMLDADVLVNANVPFALMDEPVGDDTAYDLAAVLTHEAGHALGLGESDADRAATMWPYARQGDTHQRTLEEDDERGILRAYSGPRPLAVDGCGGMRAAGSPRGSAAGWLAVAGCLLLVLVRRRRPEHGLAALVALVVLASGGPSQAFDDPSERVAQLGAMGAADLNDAEPILRDALHDASPEVRLAALSLLERAGNAEQRTLAAQAAADADPTVAARARALAPRLATRVPARVEASSSPGARARLASLLADATAEPHVGRARELGSEREGGLIWTRYRVTAPDGTERELRVPGGVVGDIGQRVGEGPRPVDGAELLVVPHGTRPPAWAYHRDGVVFGGWLGDGPAIDRTR